MISWIRTHLFFNSSIFKFRPESQFIPRICLTIEHKASISRSDSCTHYPVDRLSTFWTTGAWSRSLAELFTWQVLFFLSPGWGLCWKTKYGPVRLTIWFFTYSFFFLCSLKFLAARITLLVSTQPFVLPKVISPFSLYLTIIPQALMGYWLRGHEGERNSCFSKIQLAGQKYRDKTTLAG